MVQDVFVQRCRALTVETECISIGVSLMGKCKGTVTQQENRGISRRALLGHAALLSGLTVASQVNSALAARLRLTPAQGRGPFYPIQKPLEQDNDLTMVQDKTGRAQGELLHIMGQVTDPHGQPIAGARIEIWQTNAFGRYHHPGDRRDVRLDPYFQGYGHDTTNAGGAYRFRTIRPVAYPASGSWMRPPHIHFAVSGPGVETLVTQMYFAGNPLNERDHLLNNIPEPDERKRLMVALQPPPPSLEPASRVGVFNLVLQRKG